MEFHGNVADLEYHQSVNANVFKEYDLEVPGDQHGQA